MSAQVIVPTADYEAGVVSGVRFQVQLPNSKVRVSVSEVPPGVDPSHPAVFPEILRELAAVLAEVAQRPELILWHLPGEG